MPIRSAIPSTWRPSSRSFARAASWRLTTPSGAARVLSPLDEEDRAIHAFNERCARDERVEAVLLTVRDGLTLARKR
jgi:hypothetical protein